MNIYVTLTGEINSLINKFTTPDLNNENEAYTTDEVGDYIVNFIKTS